jgi:hypothetical protein
VYGSAPHGHELAVVAVYRGGCASRHKKRTSTGPGSDLGDIINGLIPTLLLAPDRPVSLTFRLEVHDPRTPNLGPCLRRCKEPPLPRNTLEGVCPPLNKMEARS